MATLSAKGADGEIIYFDVEGQGTKANPYVSTSKSRSTIEGFDLESIPVSQFGTWNISATQTVPLAVFRALSNGAGFSEGDIIVLRQTPPDAPEYYNASTDAVISTPGANDLGPIATATNVIVDSGTLTANLGTLNGAATEATLGTLAVESGGNLDEISSFAGSINTKIPALGQATKNGSLPVVLPTDQGALIVSDGGGSLTVDGTVSISGGGVATEATLTSIDNKVPNRGQAVRANSVPVTLASDQGAIIVDGSGVTQPVSASQSGSWTVSLGAIDNAVLDSIDSSLQGTLTVDGSGVTQPVSASSLPLPTGAASEGTLNMIASTVSGSEVQVDIVGALPPGSNNIGDVGVSSVAIPATLVNGRATVVTSGTAVAIGSATALTSGVMVRALGSNPGDIYVGASDVDDTNGYILDPGESVFLSVDNLSKVYIDASADGLAVCYLGS